MTDPNSPESNMSIRDKMAMEFLKSILSNPAETFVTPQLKVRTAVGYANSIIRKLNKPIKSK